MRIFLSSTYGDLAVYRAAACQAIRKLGHDCLGMEGEFPAESRSAMEKCVEEVSTSDVYVGLFAWRYGSVPAGEVRSITELEYRAAESRRLPCLIFLVDPDAPWLLRWVDLDAAKARIESLRAELMQRWVVNFFATPDDLAAKVAAAVGRLTIEAGVNGKTGIPSPEEVLKSYLDWMIQCHSTLEVRGLRDHGRLQLPLARMFVALRGDRAHPFERAQARLALEKGLEAALEDGELSAEEVQAARWSLLSGSAVMPSLETRDRPFLLSQQSTESLTLGEAYRLHRRLVILGDPGSGKTTLARWLALVMASALRDGVEGEGVSVPLLQVNPEVEEEGETPFLLGRAKLPILVRIAEYSEDRIAEKAAKQVPRTLTQFLGSQTWLKSMPVYGEGARHRGDRIDPEVLNRHFLDALERGEALVILDGLDEVPASSERDEILREVHRFLGEWIEVGVARVLPGNQGAEATPLGQRGNQLIVTSRIAGYHASPLEIDLPHLTIEPMREAAIRRFCDAWMEAVHEAERGAGQDGEAARAAGRIEAEALKREILDTRRRGIRDLASNPLLASVLATVFHNERAQLPSQRVRLYETAVRHLTEIWRRRAHQACDEGLSEDEVFDLMEPIASHIHQHEPTGLLPENQLANLALHHLALSRGENPMKPSLEVRQAVRSFVRILHEDVGLLAARGEGVYGFLHLTFQEYLAARHLVQDLRTAGPKIVDKVDDPRWREPLLMALGHASLHWPSNFPELVRTLLKHEGGVHDLLPRGALLIAAALSEMVRLPEDLISELGRALLLAYGDQGGGARFESLLAAVERAFSELRRTGYEREVEEVLRSSLRGGEADGPQLRATAARLIRRLDWFSPKLVRALMEIQASGASDSEFAVDRALRRAVTPAFPEPPASPERPEEDPGVEFFRWELERAVSAERRRELEERIALLEEKGRRRLAEFERKKAEFDELQRVYDQAEPPVSCQIPTLNLPFRRALESEPDLIDRVRRSSDWCRLIVALYGGLQDFDAPRSIQEYQQIAAYLQLSDNERVPFLPSYQERWQGRDTVWWMAVYLDQRAKRLVRDWERLPLFSPGQIYRDSPLTPMVLEALRDGREARALLGELWRTWHAGRVPNLRAEALVALVGLGEDVRSLLEEGEVEPLQREARRLCRQKLERLADSLADPVVRAASFVRPGLAALASTVEPRRWSAVVSSVIATVLDQGARPIDMMELLKVAPIGQKAYLLSEHLAQRIVGFGDDAIYSAAVAGQYLESSSLPVEDLVQALTRTILARHLSWENFQFGWSVETLPPSEIQKDDLPLAALKNLERIHPSIDFLRSAIVRALKPMLSRNRDLLPELLALNLGARSDHDERQLTTYSLCPGLEASPDPWGEVARLAGGVKDPYLRSRALLRLAGYRPLQAARLCQEAHAACLAIGDPHERVQVLERFLEVGPPEDRERILEEALATVPGIPCPADQARSLGRLSRHVARAVAESLLGQALAAAARVEAEAERSETLLLLMPLVGCFPDLARRARKLAESLPTAWCRSRALGRCGAQLHPVHKILAEATPEGAQVWSPVVLSSLLQDLELRPRLRLPEKLLTQVNEGLTPDLIASLRRCALDDALVLSRSVAMNIDSLLESEDLWPPLCNLLALFEREEEDALPIVAAWLRHRDPGVSSYAALCLAESNGLSEGTVPPILRLLESDVDLWRHRAARLIHHPAISPESPSRTVTALGVATLERLVEVASRRTTEAPQVRLTILWIFHDLVQDDPEAFRRWVQAAEKGGMAGEVARTILSSIEALTPAVWELFLVALKEGGAAIKTALLVSLCRLVYKKRKIREEMVSRIKPEQWEEFLGAVQELDAASLTSPRIQAGGALALIGAARRALAEGGDQPLDAVLDLADLHLDQTFGTSFSEVLALPSPDAIRETMQAIAENTLYAPGIKGDRKVRAAAVGVKDDPALFGLIFPWLRRALQASAVDSKLEAKRYFLLQIAAVAAELAPSAFANLAHAEELEPLLVVAGTHHNSFPGRAAALALLGHLRVLTEDGARAIQAAMKDVDFVRQSALSAVLRLRRLESSLLPILFEGLYNPSAMAAFAMAQVLTALGRSDHTPPEQRRRILQALAEAVRDPRSERLVHFGYVDARVPDQPRLNQAFYRALVRVAGLE